MKLTIILTLTLLFEVSSAAIAQKLTINRENVNLDHALKIIKEQSGFTFVYTGEMLKESKPIDLKFTNAPLEQVLAYIFSDQPLTYTIKNNVVVLKRKTKRMLANEIAAQLPDIAITGVVKDHTGLALPGVSVSIKGVSGRGTSTDDKGRFALQVPEKATLIFSLVGYTPKEVFVGNDKTIEVILSQEDTKLNEVVVVGYGTQKRVNLTGAVATLSGKDLLKTPTSNITNAIAGRLAGVTAKNTNGSPGGGSKLQIRGLSTMNDNSALVVIDGVVRQDGFGNLDPNEIESISVLKDASSASVYGARAANGVFLITTKKGKTGKPTITYSGMYGVQQPTSYPELMSAYDFASTRNLALMNGGRSPSDPAQAGLFYTQAALDEFKARGNDNIWYKETFKNNSPQTQHNISINGGTEAIKYFTSVGYFDQDGMYENINFKRYNFRTNIDAKVNDNLTVTLGLEGRQENKDEPGYDPGSIFRDVLRQNPTYKAYNNDGSYFNTNGEHPVAEINSSGYQRDRWNVFQGSLSFQQKLPFLTEGLSVKGLMSIYKDRLFRKDFLTPYVMFDEVVAGKERGSKSVGGQTSLSQTYTEGDQQTYNIALNYARTFGKHDVSALALYEIYNADGNTFNANRRDFITNTKDELFASGAANQGIGGNGIINDARKSVVGRFNYAFDSRYLFEATFRYDGSYRFAPEQRWGFFPAVSAGWRISEESFFKSNKSLSFIDNLKLRASTGILGNDKVDLNGDGVPDAFQFIDNYGITSGSGPVFGGVAVPYVSYGVYPNLNFTWEKQQNNNIGLDASFFGSKLTVEFDYFFRKTKDILRGRDRSTPGTFGRDLPPENYAQMKSHGWELSLGHQGQAGAVNYNLNFNISQSINKVTVIDDPSNGLDYQRQLGRPFQYMYGFVAEGLFQSKEEAANWYGGKQFGQTSLPGDIKYTDVNGNGIIDIQDQQQISDYNNTPRVTYGLSGGAKWKQFDFSFLIQGAAQSNQMLSGVGRIMYQGGGASGNFSYLADAWSPTNTDAKYPLAWVDSRSVNDRNSTFWLKKNGYARLKSIDLGYTFDQKWLKVRGIERLRVYVSGVNLLTWSQLKEFDPEVESGNGLYYPQQRNLNLGLNLTF